MRPRVGDRVHVALKDHVLGDWLPPACKFADITFVHPDGLVDLVVNNGALPSQFSSGYEFSADWQHSTWHDMDECPLDEPQARALPAPVAPVISKLAGETPGGPPHLELLQGGLSEEAA